MDKYEELKTIGRGAFAVVRLVRRKADDALLACKTMRCGMAELSAKERMELTQEVKLLHTLQHPNVVGFIDNLIDADGIMHILMEYAGGGTLHKAIVNREGEYLPEDTIWEIFVQLVLAIKFIHASNVMHRDLKTQNVLMGGPQHRYVKVADFGIAKVLQSGDGMADTIVGTPHYLSPELCQGQKYNMKSDMWALGCILYELCTLNKPFDASNMPAIIFAIMRNQPQPIPGHFSADMHEMVNALLQPSPADRPSASEVFALPIVVQHWQRWQATAAHLEGGGAPPSKHGKGGTEVQDPTGSPSVGHVAMRVDTQAASVGAAPPPQTPAAQKAELMASVRALEERMLPELAQARSDAKIHSAPDARAALAARLEDLDSELRSCREMPHLSGAVWEALGQAWGETGNFDKAISAYRTALRSRNANASLTAMEQLGNLLVRRAQQIWAMARAGDVAGAEAATSAFAGVAALGAAAKARERLRAANMADTAASAISSPEQRAARLVRKPKAPTTLLALPEEGTGGEGGSEDDGGPVWKARAAAMMAEGLGVLERLLGFGPTAERYALLGSAYKRRAWTGLGSSRKQDLRAAAEAYKTAHGFEMEMREQDPSYVPSPYARLNQLTFELLSSAKQGGSGRLCRRIQEAQEWAMLRKESDPKDVWLWLQIVDAKCLRWLSGCDGVRQGEVVSDYRLQFSVGTSMRVRSSVLDQVQFMQEVLKGRLSEEEQRRSEHLFKSGLGASGMPSSFPVSPTGAPNITADAWSAAEDMGPGELPLASVSRNVTPASPTESDEAAAVATLPLQDMAGDVGGASSSMSGAGGGVGGAGRPSTAETLASARIAPDTVIAWLSQLERRVAILNRRLQQGGDTDEEEGEGGGACTSGSSSVSARSSGRGSGGGGDTSRSGPPTGPRRPSQRTLRVVSRRAEAGGGLDTLHSTGLSEAGDDTVGRERGEGHGTAGGGTADDPPGHTSHTGTAGSRTHGTGTFTSAASSPVRTVGAAAVGGGSAGGIAHLSSIGSDTFRAVAAMPLPSMAGGMSDTASTGQRGLSVDGPRGIGVRSPSTVLSSSSSASSANPFARRSAKPFRHRSRDDRAVASPPTGTSKDVGFRRARRSVVPTVPPGVNPFSRAAKKFARGKRAAGPGHTLPPETLRQEDMTALRPVTEDTLDLDSARRPVISTLPSEEGGSGAGGEGGEPSPLVPSLPVEVRGGDSPGTGIRAQRTSTTVSASAVGARIASNGSVAPSATSLQRTTSDDGTQGSGFQDQTVMPRDTPAHGAVALAGTDGPLTHAPLPCDPAPGTGKSGAGWKEVPQSQMAGQASSHASSSGHSSARVSPTQPRSPHGAVPVKEKPSCCCVQ